MCRQNHPKNWIMGKFRVEASIFADKDDTGSPLPVDFPINQYPNPLEHFWPGSFTMFHPIPSEIDIVDGEMILQAPDSSNCWGINTPVTPVDAGYLARFPVLQPSFPCFRYLL